MFFSNFLLIFVTVSIFLSVEGQLGQSFNYRSFYAPGWSDGIATNAQTYAASPVYQVDYYNGFASVGRIPPTSLYKVFTTVNSQIHEINVFSDIDGTLIGISLDYMDKIGVFQSFGVTGVAGFDTNINHASSYTFLPGETLSNATIGTQPNSRVGYFSFTTSTGGSLTIKGKNITDYINFNVQDRYFAGLYFTYSLAGYSKIESLGILASRTKVLGVELNDTTFIFPNDLKIYSTNTSASYYDGYTCNTGPEPITLQFDKTTSVAYNACFGGKFGFSQTKSVSIKAGIPAIFGGGGKRKWGLSTMTTFESCADHGKTETVSTSYTVAPYSIYYWRKNMATGYLNNIAYTGIIRTYYIDNVIDYPVEGIYSGTNPIPPVYSSWTVGNYTPSTFPIYCTNMNKLQN